MKAFGFGSAGFMIAGLVSWFDCKDTLSTILFCASLLCLFVAGQLAKEN